MMKNRLILLGWSLLALFRISGKKIQTNRSDSGEALRSGGFWHPGEYIENQAQWGAVRFGAKYDMAYGGCGVFAVYNVMVALGQAVSVEDFEGLLESFQKRGLAFAGKFGISPRAIRSFLVRRGFRVKTTLSTDASAVDSISERGETFLVTACNGKKLSDWIHTVCITRDDGGNYIIHNGYHLIEQPDGRKIYCANGPFRTLSEAVRHISKSEAIPVMVMGIAR